MRLFPETANGQALKVALIFTAAASVVLGGALIAVNASASHQVASDGTDRLVKGVHALADGDLAGAKASGLVVDDTIVLVPKGLTRNSAPLLKKPGVAVDVPVGSLPTKLFGIRMIAWRVDSGGTATPLTAITPDLPISLATVSAPTRGTLAGQAFLFAGATGSQGQFVAAISEDALQVGSRPFVSSGLAAIPAVLAVIFVLSLVIGRSSAAPIDRNRRRQMEFAADASHELRTPLTVIRAETSLALSRPRDAEEYRRAIERISGESEKISELVDDLLFLARADVEAVEGDAQPRDLRAVVAATARRFEPVAAARSLHLAVDLDGAAERAVTAPDGWLERLVSVLLDNACRFTPEGGQVTVRVSGAPGHAVLSVEDSGPGVAPEQRERIFDRFHRGGGDLGGTGLGLSIAAAVMRRTHGRLEVTEGPRGGARFLATWRGA